MQSFSNPNTGPRKKAAVYSFARASQLNFGNFIMTDGILGAASDISGLMQSFSNPNTGPRKKAAVYSFARASQLNFIETDSSRHEAVSRQLPYCFFFNPLHKDDNLCTCWAKSMKKYFIEQTRAKIRVKSDKWVFFASDVGNSDVGRPRKDLALKSD